MSVDLGSSPSLLVHAILVYHIFAWNLHLVFYLSTVVGVLSGLFGCGLG
jgi:hypothetical protein